MKIFFIFSSLRNRISQSDGVRKLSTNHSAPRPAAVKIPGNIFLKIVLVFYFGESEELQTGGKMSGRFAEFSTSVDEFICEQKNKNTSERAIG